MATDKKFRVTLIKVRNIMGAVDAELRPGALTIIEGKNGLGKTSLVEAAKLPFAKGHKATLLREGEEEGEVVVLLDDGSGPPFLQVSATVNKEGTTRKVGYPGQPAMNRPAEVISNLRNEFTLFPTAFLTLKKDERLEMFLSAIPLKVEKSDLAGIMALSPELKKIDVNRHAFKVLAEIEKVLYDKRKGLNAIVTNNRKTALTMKAALPEEALDPAIARTQLESAKDDRDHLQMEIMDARNGIDRAAIEKKDAAKALYDKTVADARADYDAVVSALTENAVTAKDALAEDSAGKLAELATAIASAEAKAETFTRNSETRKHIEALGTEADAKEIESKALTEAIDVDLAEIRSALLDQVPIKGVTVSDGDIFIENREGKVLPFDISNTAEKIRVACDLALLHAGPLPLLLMDGAEALDEESLMELRDALEARGAQCLASRVTQSETLEVVNA